MLCGYYEVDMRCVVWLLRGVHEVCVVWLLRGGHEVCVMWLLLSNPNTPPPSSNIMELRKSVQDQFVKRHGIKLGLMSAFVKASAYSLTKIPVVNAVIDNNEIVYRDYVDISVAVATPKVWEGRHAAGCGKCSGLDCVGCV